MNDRNPFAASAPLRGGGVAPPPRIRLWVSASVFGATGFVGGLAWVLLSVATGDFDGADPARTLGAIALFLVATTCLCALGVGSTWVVLRRRGFRGGSSGALSGGAGGVLYALAVVTSFQVLANPHPYRGDELASYVATGVALFGLVFAVPYSVVGLALARFELRPLPVAQVMFRQEVE